MKHYAEQRKVVKKYKQKKNAEILVKLFPF